MTSQLTRNLYRLDEVRSALQWCILKGRHVEAAFWATELPEADLKEVVQLSWLYGFGCKALGYLTHLEKDLIETAIRLSSSRSSRDSSVLCILGLVPKDERVGAVLLPKGFTPQEQFVARAAFQGKVGPVWDWLATAEEIPWTSFKRVLDWKHGTFDEDLLKKLQIRSAELKALLCAILCMSKEAFCESVSLQIKKVPVEVAEALEEWSNLEGREARVYAIPRYCLHGTTERGGLETNQTTEVELCSNDLMEKAMKRSPAWDIDISSDERKEAFYDIFFPDDIPDEWSSDARQKSHGPGVIPPGGITWTLGAWMIKWFDSIPSSLIFEGVSSLSKRVDAEYDWDTHTSAWDAFRDGLGDTGTITWNFTPARVKIKPSQSAVSH